MKKISLLGSTGSIGVTSLKVIQAHPERYQVVALGAGRNIRRLMQQIEVFRPLAVSVLEEDLALEIASRIPKNNSVDVLFGANGFAQLARMAEADTVISAMTGSAGLIPTYEAIKAGKQVALANKETMVMAGSVIMSEAKKRGIRLIPIDSEHSAILQSMQGHQRADLKRVILTASGGPFNGFSVEEMRSVTPSQALNHPNWRMGPKISIDSATLMNKGLEAIEAKWLFDLSIDQIAIFIHRESIVHSMVEYKDGSVIAQLGIPDMTIPISYALSFPHHLENALPALDLGRIGALTFEKPNLAYFKCLDLALKAASADPSMATVLNAADEIAVASFLQGKVGFLDIPELIERTLDKHRAEPLEDIETVLEVDRWARKTARGILEKGL